jgi:hypothetical protein
MNDGEKEFSLTRAALITRGRAKSKFSSIQLYDGKVRFFGSGILVGREHGRIRSNQDLDRRG